MKRHPQFVLRLTMLFVLGAGFAHAQGEQTRNDDDCCESDSSHEPDRTNCETKSVPGTCPQWPIAFNGSYYTYYSHYHASSACNNPVVTVLYGSYPWPVSCLNSPHLCVGSGSLLKANATPHPGIPAKVDPAQHLKASMPPGFPQDEAFFKDPVSIKFELGGATIHARIVEAAVPTAGKPEEKTEIRYGLESERHDEDNVASGANYLDLIGNTTETPTKVVRVTYEGESYIIVLAASE